jgi:hypothetical protein
LTVTAQCSKFQQLFILIQCPWTKDKKSQCARTHLHLYMHVSWCTEFYFYEDKWLNHFCLARFINVQYLPNRIMFYITEWLLF